jgi:predicted ester cyclase
MGDARAVVEEKVRLRDADDREGSAALFDERCELEGPGGLRFTGPDGWREMFDLWRAAFPDNVLRDVVVRGAGDLCVEEARFVATHTGALHTPTRVIPPTGREVDLRYSIVHTVENGRITSFHLYFDQAEMLMQLGLMPLPAAAG